MNSLVIVLICLVSLAIAQNLSALVPCDRCGQKCGDSLSCCTGCGGRYGTCASSCGIITCDVIIACPPPVSLPNCTGECDAIPLVMCSKAENPGVDPVCGLVPKLTVSASVGPAGSTVYSRTPNITCGNKFNCFPKCILTGCATCNAAPMPTAAMTLPGSATTDQCASSNLPFAARHCTNKYSPFLCTWNSTCTATFPVAAVAAERRCEAVVTTTALCAKRADPSPCVGVNHPCKCPFELGCVLLVTDPDNDLNSRYVCTDPLFARVRFMALTGHAPNMRVDIRDSAPMNCSNANFSTNADVSNSVGDAAEQSVIHDDVEDAYACCVNKLTNLTNSSLPKCLHIHIAHQAQPSPSGSSATDFQMVSHHLAVCPPGVTLSAQDQVQHCECMKLAHKIVTGVSYPGPCVAAIAPSSGKRAIEQDSSSVIVSSLSTASGSPSPISGSTTASSPNSSSPSTSSTSPPLSIGSVSVGLVSSVVLLLLTSLFVLKVSE